MAEIPPGTVGLVEAEERQRKDEASLNKHTQKTLPSSRHLLSEAEDQALEEKLEKQRQVQEKVKARLAEAERKDPNLRSKNPHILE